MANTGRITTGSNPRLLQYGLDKIIQHSIKGYEGVGSKIFKSVPVDKGFYEAMEMAGMGLAAVKGEGAPISYDSVDQHWVYRWPVITYEKSARITMEAIQDNVYEKMLPVMGRCQAKSLAHARDTQMAKILNDAFSTNGPDGKPLCDDAHPIQAGGTSDNEAAIDISEDSLEQMYIMIDKFLDSDGLLSDYNSQYLVVPSELQFEACRLVYSNYRPGSADNDINASKYHGRIKDVYVWKRLTDTDAFFITTDAENGLSIAQRMGVTTDSFKDPSTKDTIVSAYERYVCFWQDWRSVCGSSGA